MKNKLIILGTVLIAAAGIFAGFAVGKPPSPPGQDPCSHGNTGKPCRPDPQPNHGKDCLHHGKKGGVNEDHCKGTTTTNGTTTGSTTTNKGGTTTVVTTVPVTTTVSSTNTVTTTVPSVSTNTVTVTTPAKRRKAAKQRRAILKHVVSHRNPKNAG